MLTHIVDTHKINPRLFVLTVSWEGSVRPGQFFMVTTPSQVHILPRPLSVFDHDAEEGTLSFLIGIRGEGTRLLSTLRVGDSLNITGPLGNGFPTHIKGAEILLMAGSEGIAPMLLALKHLSYDNNIRLLAGFRTHSDAEVMQYFAAYQDEAEISYAVEEGGGPLITALLENQSPAHTVFLCGSTGMMKACVKEVKRWPKAQVFVSLEEPMACGVGACMGCTTKGKRGKALQPCKEGPVFLAKEVF